MNKRDKKNIRKAASKNTGTVRRSMRKSKSQPAAKPASEGYGFAPLNSDDENSNVKADDEGSGSGSDQESDRQRSEEEAEAEM